MARIGLFVVEPDSLRSVGPESGSRLPTPGQASTGQLPAIAPEADWRLPIPAPDGGVRQP